MQNLSTSFPGGWSSSLLTSLDPPICNAWLKGSRVGPFKGVVSVDTSARTWVTNNLPLRAASSADWSAIQLHTTQSSDLDVLLISFVLVNLRVHMCWSQSTILRLHSSQHMHTSQLESNASVCGFVGIWPNWSHIQATALNTVVNLCLFVHVCFVPLSLGCRTGACVRNNRTEPG